MKKIIDLIILSLFISVAGFAQNSDTIKQAIDSIKKVQQQKNPADRPGIKNAIQKPTTQKSTPKVDSVKNSKFDKKAGEKKVDEKNEKEEKSTPKTDDIKSNKFDKKAGEEKVNEDEKDSEKGENSNATANSNTIKNETTLKVKIYDRNSMLTVDGVEVYLFEMPEGKFVDTNLSLNGIASFKIDKDTEYEIRTCTEGYIKRAVGIFDCNSADKMFCLRGVFHFDYGPPETEENTLLAKIKLDPIAAGQVIELDNVYYDTGKSTLRPESKKELDRLYNLMKQYNTLKIEVSSHTDSRGSAEVNMNLSSRRAKSCFTYLTGKGIAKDRIVYKGYGETRLLNQCADGVNCNNLEHQKNRRTEISILEIQPEPCEPKL